MHTEDGSAHKKYVPSMYQDLPEDLEQVIEAWGDLPAKIKSRILKIVKSSG